MRTISLFSCVLAAGLGFAIASPANSFSFSLDVSDAGGGDAGGFRLEDLENQGRIATSVDGDVTSRRLNGATQGASGNWTIDSWDSQFDPDPFITNDFQVTNNSGNDLVFSMNVAGVIDPTLAGQMVQSNIILTLNDANGTGGATAMSFGGDAVYQGQINGITELTFLEDPFSLSCADAVDCAFNGRAADAIAALPVGPVNATDIGISIRFKLSPGDSVAVLSRFEIIVPEPATALLVAGGFIALAIARRRA